MHKYNVRLVSDLFWIPTSRFTNDQSIMEVILTRQCERAVPPVPLLLATEWYETQTQSDYTCDAHLPEIY